MVSFAIICDSACDLPEPWAQKEHVYVMPFSICFSDGIYRDGIDIHRDALYHRMEREIPTTAASAADELEKAFGHIRAAGIRKVMLFSVSSAGSGMHNLMRAVAEAQDDLFCELIDTRSASTGAGFYVLHALERREAGETMDAVAQEIRSMVPTSRVCAYFKELTNMIRGGRIPKGKAYVANLLHIRPVLSMDADGEVVECKKVRSEKGALAYLKEFVSAELDRSKPYYFAVGYTRHVEDAQVVESLFRDEIARAKRFFRICLTPALGVHAGDGIFIVSFLGLPG